MLCRRLSLGLLVALLAASPAGAQPFVYGITKGTTLTGVSQCFVVRCRGAQLQITNVLTGRLLNPNDLPLGNLGSEFAHALAISPDNERAFVGIGTRVRFIDATTNLVTFDVTAPSTVSDLVVSPDSTRLYVATLSYEVTVYDTTSGAVVHTIDGLLRQPAALALSTDGRRLWVAQNAEGPFRLVPTYEMSVIDTTTFVLDRWVMPAPSTDVAVSPDGTRVYAATGDVSAISIVDAASFAVTQRSIAPSQPERLALTPDGRRLFMTFHNGPGYGVLDLATDTFTTVVAPAVTAGSALAMAPDGARVYIQSGEQMIAVDVATAAVAGTLPGGGIDIAVTPPNACQFEVPLQDRWFGVNGGSGVISVPAPAGCAWHVQNAVNASLIAFTSPTSGAGPGSVSYTVSPQPAGSIDARRDTVRIAGQAVSIVETFPRMQIDTPGGGIAGTSFTLTGWAIDIDGTFFRAFLPLMYPNTGPGVDAVHVWAYPDPGSGRVPVFLGAAHYGGDRRDVSDTFGDQYRPSGFSLDVGGLTPGAYELIVYARDRSGSFDDHASLTITVATAAPAMALDSPVHGGTVDAPLGITGWAIERATASGTGVDAVHVWAFPADGRAPIFLGAAAYGLDRPDVGAQFGARFAASGFSLTTSALPTGAYHISASAHSSAAQAFTDSRSAAVALLSSAVVIDTPMPGVSGPQPVRIAGWAADFAAATSAGIDAIHVWAYPSSGAAPAFAGVAQLGLARPDVAAVYGSALANAGYQLDVSGLPAGTYTFAVWAHSAVTGRFDRCATLTITIR